MGFSARAKLLFTLVVIAGIVLGMSVRPSGIHPSTPVTSTPHQP